MAAISGGTRRKPASGPKVQISLTSILEASAFVLNQMGAWLTASFLFAFIVWIVFMVSSLLGIAALLSIFPAPPLPVNNSSAAMVTQAVLFITFGFTSTIFHLLVGGMTRMAIRQMRRENITAGDLFNIGDVAGPLLTASLFAGIVTAAGIMITDFVRLSWYVEVAIDFFAYSLFMFTLPLIVDQHMSAFKAFLKSADVLKSHLPMSLILLMALGLLAKGSSLLFVVMFSRVFVLGGLLQLISTLLIAPIPIIAFAINYRNFMQAGVFPDTITPFLSYPGGVAPSVPSGYYGQSAPPYPPQPGYSVHPGYAPPPQTTHTTPPPFDLNAYPPQPPRPDAPPLNGPYQG